MKKLLALTALLTLALAPAAGAKPKKLPYHEAALQARVKMGDWALSQGLNYPQGVKCQRKSRIRFRCSGFSTLDEERFSRRCDFIAIVTNRYRRLNYGGYWEAVAQLPTKKCVDTAKLYLEESRARNGVLLAAQQSNRTNAVISYLYRQDSTSFFGAIAWHFGPDIFTGQDCQEDVEIKLGADNKLTATFSGQFCYSV